MPTSVQEIVEVTLNPYLSEMVFCFNELTVFGVVQI